METFVEYFEDFKKQYNYEKLFFEGLISDKEKKTEKRKIISISVIGIVLCVIIFFYMPIFLPLFTITISVVYLISYMYDIKRKEFF